MAWRAPAALDAVFDIAVAAALSEFAQGLRNFDRTLFARVAIHADEPPRVLPSRDGVHLKNRFRRVLGLGDQKPPRLHPGRGLG